AACGSKAPSSRSASATTPVTTSTPPAPSTTASSTRPAPPASSASSWPGYHNDNARTGAVPASALLASALSPAWTAHLGSSVHGQVVVGDGRIIAATERNRVVALDPQTGAVQWSVSLGAPLTDVQ